MRDAANTNLPTRSPLAETLKFMKELRDAGMLVVPATPSQAMLQAGAEAGGIDPNTAAQVFQAMLQAEDEAPKTTAFEVFG